MAFLLMPAVSSVFQRQDLVFGIPPKEILSIVGLIRGCFQRLLQIGYLVIIFNFSIFVSISRNVLL